MYDKNVDFPQNGASGDAGNREYGIRTQKGIFTVHRHLRQRAGHAAQPAYCPALVEVFELEEHAQEARRAWMSVALESRLRGGNRFRLLSQACVRIAQQGAAVPGLDGILHWVESGSELTHGALAARVKRGAGPALARALAWSREVNRRLTAMPKECAPFAAVEGCLAAVRAVADVVAMGTGTPAAVRGEWTRGGLSGYTDAVFAAPQDGKAEALIPVFGAGYLPSHMLVVGDTLGDAALAAQAGALFFPILPGREEACWQRLAEEGFPKFLHGSFAGAYEDTLRKAQRSLLP